MDKKMLGQNRIKFPTFLKRLSIIFHLIMLCDNLFWWYHQSSLWSNETFLFHIKDPLTLHIHLISEKNKRLICVFKWIPKKFHWSGSSFLRFNPYPANTESDKPLPPVNRARPTCTSVQSDQALYCWLTNIRFSSWLSLKMMMDSAKNGRWIIPW